MAQTEATPGRSPRLIGDPGCRIKEVASTLCSLSTTIYNDLPSLAIMLDLPAEKVEHVRNDINIFRKPSLEIIFTILTEYRLRHAKNASIEKLMNSLCNLGLDEAASSLGKQFSVEQTGLVRRQIGSPILFSVTPPSDHFTGRVGYLEKIQSSFSRGDTAIICQSLVGLGGIGKTDLARKAVDYYIRLDENKELNVIWLNAETEPDLISDFRTLAKDENALGVNIKDSAGGEKEIWTIVKEVYTYFRNKRCLFVFDNAENEEYLDRYLPTSYAFLFISSNCRKPMVLITSRDNEWSTNCSVVKLELFPESDAIQFVQRVLNLTQDYEIAFIKELVFKLEYLPLAIKQATFYIAAQMKADPNYGVKTYLEEWGKNCQKLLDKKIKGENKTTYTTWKTTMHKIANDESCGAVAVDVLRKLAFMTPDGIKLEFFKNNQRLDFSDIREAFTLLLRYSMISRAAVGFSIHRLVQEVTRIDMRLNGSEEYELDQTLTMITTEIDSANLSHAQSAWHHAKRHKKLAIKYSNVPSRVCIELRSVKGLKFSMEFAKQELKFLNEALANRNHMSILNVEAEYCGDMFVFSDLSGYDQLWKKVHKVLRDGSAPKWELAELLKDFCYIDSEKSIYPEAWSGLDGILRSVDVSSCDEIWMYKLAEFGRCLYYAFDFSSSNIFFKNALKIIERTQSKDTILKRHIEYWLKLTSLYTCPSGNTEASISELLDSLCLLLKIMNGNPMNIYPLAFETSQLLFYKFGVIDEALSISLYVLFIVTEADGVVFEVPNTQIQMSILLCEQGNFQEALECSIKAKRFLKDMQVNTFYEVENQIYLARALGRVGREEESINTIRNILPQLLSLEFKCHHVLRLIWTNTVAAEVLLSNRENQLAQKLVNRVHKLLSKMQMNISMPFLSRRLCQIKQKLAMKTNSEMKTESIENRDGF